MENNIKPDAILAFTARRSVTTLFKDFLNIIRILQEEHAEALDKLAETLPEDGQKQLYLADHFTEEKVGRLRKEILSKGNDVIREIEEQIKRYDIKLK